MRSQLLARFLLFVSLTGACQAEAPPPEPASPSAWQVELSQLDARLGAVSRHAEAYPRDHAHLEAVARLQLGRGKLTGRLEDYLQARTTIDRAFEVAGGPYGPLLERARIALSLHQLPQARADLELVERSILLFPGDAAQIIALRGDLAFQTGDYPEAMARFAELHRVDPHPGSAFRLALYAWKTGDPDAADRWLAEALSMAETPHEQAWMSLQRGLLRLDQQRYDEAAAWYARAAALFPGWWLIEEHQAEVEALLGQTAEAERRYRDLVSSTGNPEFMDALAALLAERAPEEAERLIEEADRYWEKWLVLLPEAAYGHALEHLLEHGSPAEALDLARRNHALRPNGEATTLLARALLRAGQIDEARARVEEVWATPWRTPDLLEVTDAVRQASAAR